MHSRLCVHAMETKIGNVELEVITLNGHGAHPAVDDKSMYRDFTLEKPHSYRALVQFAITIINFSKFWKNATLQVHHSIRYSDYDLNVNNCSIALESTKGNQLLSAMCTHFDHYIDWSYKHIGAELDKKI